MREKTDAEFQRKANRAGKDTVASLRDDLDALEHARECNGETPTGRKCRRGSETRRFKLKDGTTGRQMKHNNEEAWHDEDAADRQIKEAPLSVEVRSGWYTPGEGDNQRAEEYQILLSTGGPASRIVGELDQYGQPESARFEFQDWFRPWTAARLTREEESTLLEFAQHFYFGE